MSFEEQLLSLNEEELFGKQNAIPIEQSEVIQNMARLSNMLQDGIGILKQKDMLLYEDAQDISQMQSEIFERLGSMLGKLEKYM